MKSILAATALLLTAPLLSAPALAQARPAPARAAPVDPAARQVAAALVAQIGIKAQLQRQMNANIAQMKSGAVIRSMLAGQPGFIPAYQANKAKFDAAMAKAGTIQAGIAQKVVDQNIDAVIADATNAYARSFTLAELNGLLAFYRSPLGVALQNKQPGVAVQIAQSSATRIGQKIDVAVKANEAKLREALAPLNSTPPPAAK